MKWLKIIILILSLVPIEFIGLFTDYQTGLLIGYIPFIIVAILISISIFKFGLKNNISIIISRCIGIFLSWECVHWFMNCLLYTSPSPRDQRGSRMPSSA